MILYSSPACAYSHRVRIVLFEKNIAADIEYVDTAKLPEDLLAANPLGNIPTMVDRDLVLSDSRIIMEYLDERFPHPPLHPMDPVARARARMLVHRIDQDWSQLSDEIEKSSDPKKKAKAAKQLRDGLVSAAPVFAAKPYFLSDEFSLVDCSLAALLWRLPVLGIELPRQAESIRFYANRLFERESFQASLSEKEREYATLNHRASA
ncbi:glutathione S-transferase N-terminal domain-containing protein [Candidatus Methylocalor cossyra]